MADTLDSLRAQNAEQAVEIERLKRERDIAIGERVACSKLIRRLRNAFVDIRDNLDDEGDRVFFGSTNQADDFREIVERLEELNWADILRDAQNVDPFETARAAVVRAEAAEARCAELEKALTLRHQLHSCNAMDCAVCNRCLAVCTVCGGAEAGLTTRCCGRKLTADEHDAVCAGSLDFDGEWFDPKQRARAKP